MEMQSCCRTAIIIEGVGPSMITNLFVDYALQNCVVRPCVVALLRTLLLLMIRSFIYTFYVL